MSSEDQELLARISHLAGHINRHKNQQAGVVAVPSSQGSSYRHSAPSTYHPYNRPYYPTRGGYRASKPNSYRHRTLVLNSSSGKTDKKDSGDSQAVGVVRTAQSAPASASASTSASAASAGPSSGTSWVAKTDRHMQLINSSVFEKESQARSKAIEKTRLQKQRIKDERERIKLRNHFAYLANGRTAASSSSSGGLVGAGSDSRPAAAPAAYQIVVQGIPFSVAKNGSKLVKVPGDPNPPSSTPKTAIVGGVKFYRSKNGNLYRHAVVRAQRRAGTVKKVNQPCRAFSTTGSCAKGPLCRYMHDAAKVAACKEFLQRGVCASGDNCDLSHELTPERTPLCVHYAKGNCTNPHCPYTHSEVSTGALACRPFGLYGYCDKGASCEERHVFECPDFANTGVCKTKGCKLPHRERASFMRRAQASEDSANADDDADLVDASSDESVNSDDVDSDEVDEFVGADGEDADADFVMQKDFIEF